MFIASRLICLACFLTQPDCLSIITPHVGQCGQGGLGIGTQAGLGGNLLFIKDIPATFCYCSGLVRAT